MSAQQPDPLPAALARQVAFAEAVLGRERVRAELVRILLAAIAHRAPSDPSDQNEPDGRS
ncbi:MAG: hypothetical protein WCK28_00675 [Burkholderiales bacterium]|jgi:hypothetical protein